MDYGLDLQPLKMPIQQFHKYLMSTYYKPCSGSILSIRVSQLTYKKQLYLSHRPFSSAYCVPGGTTPGTENKAAESLSLPV